MTPERRLPQWRIDLVVYHGPTFGHELVVSTQRQGFAPIEKPAGRWKGIGIPESVLNSARAMLDSLLTDHLVTRYGVQGEMDLRRGDEVGPF